MSNSSDKMKNAVALEASKLIQSDLKVGLGTGSTVRYLLEHISLRHMHLILH